MVTLYSQPGCAPCGAAKRNLTAEGVPFTEVNVQEDAEAAERLKRNGITGTPAFGFHGHIGTLADLPEIIRAHKETTND